eukprot:GHVR01117893.1.p1 GENE.GHVR01117893.1~~GHVR01117893.1.p1  ORF type:complete len:131 (+),score=34.72 GHVR01117893.1:78-470(+)
MSEVEESLESLQEKLAQSQEQLLLIENALNIQPNNEELDRLRSDLLDFISLTKDVINFKQSTANIGTTLSHALPSHFEELPQDPPISGDKSNYPYTDAEFAHMREADDEPVTVGHTHINTYIHFKSFFFL